VASVTSALARPGVHARSGRPFWMWQLRAAGTPHARRIGCAPPGPIASEGTAGVGGTAGTAGNRWHAGVGGGTSAAGAGVKQAVSKTSSTVAASGSGAAARSQHTFDPQREVPYALARPLRHAHDNCLSSWPRARRRPWRAAATTPPVPLLLSHKPRHGDHSDRR